MAALDGLVFRFSPKRTIHGISVAVNLFSSAEERDLAFGRIATAVELLSRYAPVRHSQVRRDIRRILVTGAVPTAHATYDEHSHTCALLFDWMVAKETPPEAVAGVIVHEAQHGRLCRLGFGYEPDERGRVERLCFRATRATAQRLPGAEEVFAAADAGMELPNDAYSWASYLARERAGIGKLKLPRILRAGLLRLNVRRAARAAKAEASPKGRQTRS